MRVIRRMNMMGTILIKLPISEEASHSLENQIGGVTFVDISVRIVYKTQPGIRELLCPHDIAGRTRQ